MLIINGGDLGFGQIESEHGAGGGTGGMDISIWPDLSMISWGASMPC